MSSRQSSLFYLATGKQQRVFLTSFKSLCYYWYPHSLSAGIQYILCCMRLKVRHTDSRTAGGERPLSVRGSLASSAHSKSNGSALASSIGKERTSQTTPASYNACIIVRHEISKARETPITENGLFLHSVRTKGLDFFHTSFITPTKHLKKLST